MFNFTRISLIFSLFLLLGTTACFRVEDETAVIRVPGMGSNECAALVTNHLQPGKYAGLKGPVIADPETGTVQVTFQSTQIALKNIEHLIADLGFDANEIPGNATAREKLPEACR